MSNNYCTIKVLEEGYSDIGASFNIEIRSAYDEGFVRALKETIPFDERQWSEDRRRWFTIDFYLSDVCDLAREYYAEATLVEGDVSTNLHTGQETVQERLF